MAPSKPDLTKIGLEAFAMLDEFVAQRRKKQHQQQPHLPPQQQQQQQYYYYENRHQYQPSKPHVYQVIVPVPATVKEAVSVDCYEAAKFHDGTVIVDYPKTNKKTPMRMA